NLAYHSNGLPLFNPGYEGQGIIAIEENNIYADPAFVDPSNLDFHLQGTSLAINAGFNLAGLVDLDLDGNARGAQPDIGAYEYGGVPSPLRAPAPNPDPAPAPKPTPSNTHGEPP